MPEKANGDYYYVESETVNDLMDDFAFYQTGTDMKLHDEANDAEAGYVAGAGWDAPAGGGYHVDGTQVVGPQQSLTDNTVTATDGALADVSATSADVDENFKEIYEVLAAHGLVA